MRIGLVIGVAVATGTFLAVTALGGAAAEEKQPPACSAISFRPVPSGLTDGEQDAGLYKSHFGRIEVKATVKSGEPQHYYVEINGKPPMPITGLLPKSTTSCAKAKRLNAPGKPPATCLGDRFTVVIDHVGERRYVLFYAHSNGEWRFCSAGAA